MTRICTSIEQSQKLLELGIDPKSADMYWWNNTEEKYYEASLIDDEFISDMDIPAWSLTALLDILKLPTLEKANIGKDKTGWMVTTYPDNHRYDSSWHDNPIDACVEMIYTMHEQNML